jgi:hypothetical protein
LNAHRIVTADRVHLRNVYSAAEWKGKNVDMMTELTKRSSGVCYRDGCAAIVVEGLRSHQQNAAPRLQ